jgi:hypothetical protein
MFFSTITKVAVVLAISSQAALAASTASSTKNVKSQALSSHNKYRSKHHVATVRWSTKLANHATKVSKTCVWGHSVVCIQILNSDIESEMKLTYCLFTFRCLVLVKTLLTVIHP